MALRLSGNQRMLVRFISEKGCENKYTVSFQLVIQQTAIYHFVAFFFHSSKMFPSCTATAWQILEKRHVPKIFCPPDRRRSVAGVAADSQETTRVVKPSS